MCKKLSVLVPVYNSEKYLKRTLDSILESTLNSIEIIIIDDNSPGNCKEIVDSYNNPDIKYIKHDKNKGLFQARYTGILNATGEFIAHLDSDDWVNNTLYLDAYNKAKESNSDLVLFNAVQCDEKNYRWQENHNKIIPFSNKTGEEILKQTLYSNSYAWIWHVCWNKLIKKETALKVANQFKNFNNHLNMCEDLLWSISLFIYLNDKNTISAISNSGFTYFRHSESITITHSYNSYLKKMLDLKIVFQEIKKLFKINNLYTKNELLIQQMFATIYNNYLQNAPEEYLLKNQKEYSTIKTFIKQHDLTISENEITNRVSEEILQKVLNKNIKEVSIFGMGKLCELLINKFNENKIKVHSIILTNKKDEQYKHIPIYNINDFKNTKIFFPIVIASIGSFYQIKDSLYDVNTQKVGVFD